MYTMYGTYEWDRIVRTVVQYVLWCHIIVININYNVINDNYNVINDNYNVIKVNYNVIIIVILHCNYHCML